jgi:hypothetical protein
VRLRTTAMADAPGTTPNTRRSEIDHVTGPSTATVLEPHDEQKRAPTGRSLPQDAQLRAVADIRPPCSHIERS